MTLTESGGPCRSQARGLSGWRQAARVPTVPHSLSISALNAADRGAFTRALAAVFEQSPWVAERAWATRPYASVRDLHAAMVAAVRAAGPESRLALLKAHPDLAGKAARRGAMSENSVTEQASAGLDRLTEEEYARFQRLNAAYREWFGFPFIIAARHRDKHGILDAFERRLGHTREAELDTALAEVAEIARLRLQALVAEP